MTTQSGFQSHQKAELHAHLNGSVPFEAVEELASTRVSRAEYVITEPVESLAAYFAPWAVSRQLASSFDNLTQLVRSVASALASDGVRYAELRNSVRHLADLNKISLSDAIDWLLNAFDSAAAAEGVDLRLIVTLTREHFTIDAAERMLQAMREHSDHHRLVGIDLAGDENLAVPREAARLFRLAKEELGVGVTIHAGEVTGTVDNVLWAVHDCRADRIGHGLAVATDEHAMAALIETDTCLEVCITSNLLTSSVRTLAEHPVREFVHRGVPIVICSDNPGVHARSLSYEYALFDELLGGVEVLERMYETQTRYAFGG